VLLIDEIDKADIEFPNDLLQELDRMEFHVYETARRSRREQRPIVIITSNNEKELPDAFLRRCFFHYIRFPDRETMQRSSTCTSRHQEQAGARGAERVLRDPRGAGPEEEALDLGAARLAEAADGRGHPPETLREAIRSKLIPPLHGALLKNEQDVHLFERLAFMARTSTTALREAVEGQSPPPRRQRRPGECCTPIRPTTRCCSSATPR
jgi:MoxR-like ATPase